MRIELDHPADYAERVDVLLRQHYNELATDKALMKLAPDWGRYATLWNEKKLFCLFAFEDNLLIGYSCNIIGPHLHYKDLIVSSNDVLFVGETYRGTAGARLMAATVAEAKARGAAIHLWHAKEGSTLDRIMDRKVVQGKARVQDIIYSVNL